MGKQKSKLERKAELRKQYKVYVSAYGGYANETKEQPVVDIVEEVAKFVEITPSYLYTIAIGEGLGKLYIDISYNYKNNKLRTDQKISGFQHLGLDLFSHPVEYNRFSKYLPSDYNQGDEFFPVRELRNERYGKEIVPSADFKDLESALYGFGAVLRQKKEVFIQDYRRMGLKNPTEDQIAYWIYYYYQAEGDARRALRLRNDFDIFKDKETSRKSIHIKALERVASWRYVLHYEIFSS